MVVVAMFHIIGITNLKRHCDGSKPGVGMDRTIRYRLDDVRQAGATVS